IEAHAALFADPGHGALVVPPGDAPLAGFFRIGLDALSASDYLPFYELLDAASVLPDGRKVSDLAWVNYRTEEPIFTSDRVSNPRLEIQPRLLFPDDGEESAPGAALSPARQHRAAHVARVAGYAAVGVVAGAVLFNVYHALASGRAPVKPGPSVATPSLRERVDRMADTMALAVGAFELRARLFDGRKMGCPDLARGLVDLEERWTSYNAARKDDAGALDSARNARDRSLYSDGDAVERRFERSKCARLRLCRGGGQRSCRCLRAWRRWWARTPWRGARWGGGSRRDEGWLCGGTEVPGATCLRSPTPAGLRCSAWRQAGRRSRITSR